MPCLRRVLASLAVLATCAGAAWGALAIVSDRTDPRVGTVRVSADAHHEGALDLYVPLVDWGVRFPGAVDVPARVALDLRTVDRRRAERAGAGARSPTLTLSRRRRGRDRGLVIRMLGWPPGVASLAHGAPGGAGAAGPRRAARHPSWRRAGRPRGGDRAPAVPAGAPAGRSRTRSTTPTGPTSRRAARHRQCAETSAATLSEELDDAARGPRAADRRRPGARFRRPVCRASPWPRTCTTTCWPCPRWSGRRTAGRCCSPATSLDAGPRSRPCSPPGWRISATRWSS